MGKQKRNYSNEFKAEGVRLSYQRENIKELADELGIQVAYTNGAPRSEKHHSKKQ